MDWYQELSQAMPPAAQVQRASPDWAGAEAALGVRMPADFKRYVQEWGTPYVGRFLFTCMPGHQNPNVDLVSHARYVTHALSTLKAQHPDIYTAPVYPEAGGFLSAGRTDNGDFLGWMTRGDDPDAWPAAIWGDEDGTPEVFEGVGFGEMMTGIVTGRLRPNAFPQGLWAHLPLGAEPLD